MIQRSTRVPKGVICDCGSAPRLIEVMGRGEHFVECAICGIRSKRCATPADALAVFRSGLVQQIPRTGPREVLTLRRTA